MVKCIYNSKKLNLNLSDKLDLLVVTIKNELTKEYTKFQIKIIQLYYDDNYTNYQKYKEEDITNVVAI
jgi:hypothetical protein